MPIDMVHPAPGLGALPPRWLVSQPAMYGPGTAMVAHMGAALGAVRVPSMGEMLPGKFVDPSNPIAAAMYGAANPGMGDLTSGRFVIPQNPILAGRGMGDLTPGAFPVPMNPILAGRGMGCADCGGGCNGMGDYVGDAAAGWISAPSPISMFSNATFWGGLAVAAFAYMEFFNVKRGRR